MRSAKRRLNLTLTGGIGSEAAKSCWRDLRAWTWSQIHTVQFSESLVEAANGGRSLLYIAGRVGSSAGIFKPAARNQTTPKVEFSADLTRWQCSRKRAAVLQPLNLECTASAMGPLLV